MVDFNALAGTVVELYKSDGKLDDADAILIEEKYDLDFFGHDGATQICEGVNDDGVLSSKDNLDEFSADDQTNLRSSIDFKPREAHHAFAARLSADKGVSCDRFFVLFSLDDPNIPAEYQSEFRELAKKGGYENIVDECDIKLMNEKNGLSERPLGHSPPYLEDFWKTVEVPGYWPWSDPIKKQVFDYTRFYTTLVRVRYETFK